jgi:membrane protein
VLSTGAFVAIVVWLAASAGFAFHVVNFSSYDHTYGSVAGVVVTLLWLWLTNLALLFGAELDSEIERARELHRGLPAEEWLQLPVRSDRGIRKAQARREKDWAAGRAIRESRVGGGDPGDRPY